MYNDEIKQASSAHSSTSVISLWLAQPWPSHTVPCPLASCSHYAKPNAVIPIYLVQINVDHISFHFYFLNDGFALQLGQERTTQVNLY